ncbi:MAG: glycosyl transferase family 2 [Anaerocolumna sp.]|jgi:glycosyltransferase involved in cell wall biosynthesis|nr:glycosyl transferase family 2 [Anaerocolumna sp.]
MQAASISLCMIVKDEELVLENCLASVKDLVDEIIIVDTGSIDKTKEIARIYGAKIFDLPWENDFSKARNVSLTHATCDWILLLDADEVLNEYDIAKFQPLMENSNYDGYHFTILNFLHDNDTSDYATHYAFRFLRNTGTYHFTGNIHEQIEKINGDFDPSRFTLADITLYHYGYTTSIVKSKNKRERNMPLLKKALEESPNNPFFLFNMGNEYMADIDYINALDYYEKAYKYITSDQAYTPHLYYRMILCFIELKEYSKALDLVFKALKQYPECTDIEYCKAIIYHKTYSHLLAVKSLNRCIEMGEPPMNYKFLNDCATNRSYALLGEIYYIQMDYENALDMYQLLYEKNHTPELLYKITPLLNLLYEDKNIVVDKLWQHLSLHNGYNIIYVTKLLLQEKLLEQALNNLKELAMYKEYETEYLFLYAKLNFYKGNYKRTQRLVSYLMAKDITRTSLGNLYVPSLTLTYLTHLYTNSDFDKAFEDSLERFESNTTNNTFIYLYAILKNSFTPYIEDTKIKLNVAPKDYELDVELIIQVIEEILLTGQIEYLEKVIILLPYVKIHDIYLRISKLYMKYNYKEKAIEAIKKSYKEYDLIDSECAFYLSRNL